MVKSTACESCKHGHDNSHSGRRAAIEWSADLNPLFTYEVRVQCSFCSVQLLGSSAASGPKAAEMMLGFCMVKS